MDSKTVGPSTSGQVGEVAANPSTRQAMQELLSRVFNRDPGPRQIDGWLERLRQFPEPDRFIETLIRSRPAQAVKVVPVHNEPGHFFSPIVDPDQVGDYVRENRRAAFDRNVAGVAFPLEEMEAFWLRNQQVIAQTPFPEKAHPAFRYSFTGGPYPHGDGTTLRAIVADRRPKHIIEIGSGFSTACMLDTIDEFGLDTRLTCIEPYPARLKSLIRPEDEERVTIVAEGIQGQPLDQFAALEPNDILFIDSTHVLKTGSDVHYELFYILPVLKPGVIIHIHDCNFRFEYSDRQIFTRNLSWNEAYAVRALLMFSTRFRILFSGTYFAAHRRELIETTFPGFLRNPGGAIWLQVIDDGGPQGLEAVGGLPGFDARMIFRPEEAPAVAPHIPGEDAEAGIAARRPGASFRWDPPMEESRSPQTGRVQVQIGGIVTGFNILRGAGGPAFFSLGVRKSGSTMLHRILAALAVHNDINVADLPDAFFRKGLRFRDWGGLDLASLLHPGNLYTGFRSFPRSFAQSQAYHNGLKVFMHRDPRDAIVSQYFSDAYSHSLPDMSNADGLDHFLEKRSAALSTDIDTWVVEKAPPLARALEECEPLLEDGQCLTVPYETYVFEKSALIKAVLAHFGWHLSEDHLNAILREADFIPESEDPNRFVRKAVPGDHKVKLKPETIEKLDTIFEKGLKSFGYV